VVVDGLGVWRVGRLGARVGPTIVFPTGFHPHLLHGKIELGASRSASQACTDDDAYLLISQGLGYFKDSLLRR
jgi:hypothetical protein